MKRRKSLKDQPAHSPLQPASRDNARAEPATKHETASQKLRRQTVDSQELALNLMKATGEAIEASATFWSGHKPGTRSAIELFAPRHAVHAMGSLAKYYATHPKEAVKHQVDLLKQYGALGSRLLKRATGGTPESGPTDKRFRDASWDENFILDAIKQSYLIGTKWLLNLTEHAAGLDPITRQRAHFYLQQYADALAPTNFLLTNPEALRLTLESKGENLLKGIRHFREDLEAGNGSLRVRQTDMSAFTVGENLALTPGKIVYQNQLMQLIQYEPATKQVYARPLLIFPPWINKYYILDLTPEKSFIKYAISMGYTVFVVSWVNPDQHLAQMTFEDYMHHGVLDGLDAVEQATGAKEVNAIGYCIGGTLLGASLAYLAAQKDKRIKSATFFAAQVDFTEAGDLKIFIDPEQIDELKEKMDEAGGVLEGATMAQTFNLLRSRDLIWNYVVNNYLLGREPPVFDLLYWNADATRMPEAMHLFYLKECYLQNNLAEGRMVLGGEKLDLSRIKIPVYLQSSRDDHIAPYRSVYKGLKLFGGKVKFIIAGSGHIAGVINPPAANKYQFWTNDQTPDNPEDWLATASEHKGSWWPDWERWLRAKSGKKVPARHPGDGALCVLEDAPGSYVTVKAD